MRTLKFKDWCFCLFAAAFTLLPLFNGVLLADRRAQLSQAKAPSGLNPPLTGLWAWFKPEAMTNTVDGSEILLWPDSSGNGRNLIGSNSVAFGFVAPLYDKTVQPLNGYATAQYPGVATDAHFIFVDVAGLNATGGEIFLVQRSPSSFAGGHNGWTRFGSSVDNDHFPFVNGGDIYSSWGSTVRKNCGTPTGGQAIADAWRVIDVWSDNNDWAMQIDNAAFFSTAVNTVGFLTAPPAATIGFSVNVYFQGWHAEILIYAGKLSSGDRAAVHTYLKAKYGLSY